MGESLLPTREREQEELLRLCWEVNGRHAPGALVKHLRKGRSEPALVEEPDPTQRYTQGAVFLQLGRQLCKSLQGARTEGRVR